MTTTYQPFGKPTNSDYGKSRGSGKTHWGQDFTAANGTQIPSATAGTVIFSGYNPSGGLGWCVVVKDANGVGHVYAHMGFAQENNNADADGNSVAINKHIGEQGSVQTQEQYNAAIQQQASALFNSIVAVNNWDAMNYLGKLSAFVNLYNATDQLGEVFSGTGNNLPGDLSTAAAYLQLAQGLQSGDSLIIANGLNSISDGALDSALNQAFGTTAAGNAVPYLSCALAIRNFADNPEQAVLTMAGTYAGESFGIVIGGPIGAAIGGAIGGLTRGEAVNGEFFRSVA